MKKYRDREVPTQFSRIGTLKENTRDFQQISPLLTDLANSVCEKLQENNMTCKSVSIVAILDDLYHSHKIYYFGVGNRRPLSL